MRRAILRGFVTATTALFATAALLAFLATLLFTFALLVYYNPPLLGVIFFPTVTALLGLLTVCLWPLVGRLSGRKSEFLPRGTMLGEVAEALRRLWALRRRPSG